MTVAGVSYSIPSKNCILTGNMRVVITKDKDLSLTTCELIRY
jgi:hypothetical protein